MEDLYYASNQKGFVLSRASVVAAVTSSNFNKPFSSVISLFFSSYEKHDGHVCILTEIYLPSLCYSTEILIKIDYTASTLGLL